MDGALEDIIKTQKKQKSGGGGGGKGRGKGGGKGGGKGPQKQGVAKTGKKSAGPKHAELGVEAKMGMTLEDLSKTVYKKEKGKGKGKKQSRASGNQKKGAGKNSGKKGQTGKGRSNLSQKRAVAQKLAKGSGKGKGRRWTTWADESPKKHVQKQNQKPLKGKGKGRRDAPKGRGRQGGFGDGIRRPSHRGDGWGDWGKSDEKWGGEEAGGFLRDTYSQAPPPPRRNGNRGTEGGRFRNDRSEQGAELPDAIRKLRGKGKLIQITNCPEGLNKTELRQAFQDVGPVEKVEVDTRNETAYICFSHSRSAYEAEHQFDGGEINGCTIKIKIL